jgi:hypothetical protein
MLGARPAKDSSGGECNFSIGLVLACVIDGLATEVWPVEPNDDQWKRMKELLLERLQWGEKADGWITKVEAARVLYHEVRNPLVHNLGANTRWKGRRPGFSDAAIILGLLDGSRPSPDALERLEAWPPKSPVIWAKAKSDPGPRRFVVSAPALFWHVKRLVRDLATDANAIQQATTLRKRRRVR